jgi:ligand-binding sensor domain-containing protein/tRNA A-37 threonylcarbamoyl transferase component Bud32
VGDNRAHMTAVLALLLLAAAGVPLDPGKAITQYVHATWGTEQGLPQNSVLAMIQARDGYLWLGTQEGLVRFDGVRFVVFDNKNTPEMRHSYVSTLLEDRAGTLWIGTVGGGLSRLRHGRFDAFTTREGLSNDNVRALHEDREGNLWIGSDGGLDRFQDGRPVPAAGAPKEPVRCLLGDREGSLWLGTDGAGLRRFQGGKWTALTRVEGLPNPRVSSLLQDREGRIWVGTQGGLGRIENGRLSTLTTRDGLLSDIVTALYEDHAGGLWVGTYGGGVGRLKAGRFSAFTSREGLSNDTVASILEDREGSLWIGTDGGGLNRLTDGKLTTLGAKEGLSSDLALSVSEDRDGALWVGTHGGGLNRLKDGKVSVLGTKQGLASDVVFSTLQDVDGSLWIGTDSGLHCLRDGKLTRLTTRDGLSSDRIRALFQDRRGSTWVGTDGGGLNRLENGRPTSLTTREGLSNDIVTSIFEDREGSLWVGTEGGLNRIRDGHVTRFTTKEGLAHDFVFSIHQDVDGVLWFGTFGGLNRLEKGRFTTYTTRQGLFDDLVAQIVEDARGNFWMSSNKGIFRARREDLNRVAAGTLPAVTSVAYGTADGMRSRECNGGFQPASATTRDGRIWFPTVKGVVVVDPEHVPRNDVLPPVVVEEFLVDDQRLDTAREVSLPPGKQRFEFRYTALSFRSPERVLFKYRLEGQDEGWVDAGTRRTAYYTNVPHGTHTFRVRASNDDGVWNEAGAGFTFSLAPRFHETWWFYVLCAGALAASLWGAYRARVRRLTQREQELLVLVDERTKDLRQAQEKISRLLAASPAASQSIPAWSRALAEEIAQSIGVERIGLWEVDKEGLSPLSDGGLSAPSLEELQTLVTAEGTGSADREQGTIVPITGTGGQLCGALVISGRSVEWGETERRLVAGLAHQLGGALEMSRMRRQLAAAEERRAATRREMHARGIATLQICPVCGRCYDHTVPACAEDGSRLESPRPLPLVLFERYRLLRILGQGGMGMVLAARDQKLDREVAIKLIRPEHFGEPELKERFEREARTVARIQHEGVIALHDSGELPDGTAFLVMEKLQGSDLALVLKTHGPGSSGQVAALVRQGCSALGAAHRAGVVHRDIKPENIFLADGPGGFRVKLLDFGLAKSMTLEKGLTQTGMVVGTPRYMSPEQVRDEEVDARSDIYSFAAVCYEALTGRKLIAGDELGRILIDVLHTAPPPPSSLLTGIASGVDEAFAFALAKDRGQRPTGIEAWGRALGDALESAAGEPGNKGWPLSLEVASSATLADRSTAATAQRLTPSS